MTPEIAVMLSAAITTGGGLLTVLIARTDKLRGRRDRKDAKVLQVEQAAFDRATKSDVELIKRLQERVVAAEKRADEADARVLLLATRVYRLERILIAAGLDLPP